MGKSGLEGKSFQIPKQLVWEAYRRVKANKGAAGVDGQSMKDFEEDLRDNLYRPHLPADSHLEVRRAYGPRRMLANSCIH